MEKIKFSKTVYLLSFVSLFADIASELLYPVLPLYLKSIGLSSVYIGALEGLSDLISGLSKSFFGKWSDRLGRRMPFIWSGYMLSSFSKGLIGLIVSPWWILFCRTSDRLGKGIRTGARDALLSLEATEETKGRVFGFHRALDTTGAFIGPILALVFLHFYPGKYRELFFYSLIPVIFVASFLFLVKEEKHVKKEETGSVFRGAFSYWFEASREYKKVMITVLLFTLVNSSDIFLLMKAREIINSDLWVIGFYILYNFVYAGSSYRMGAIADRVGKKYVFMFGLFLFSITYLLIGMASTKEQLILAFVIYGLFAASTEGITKAWISSLCKKEDLGVALGLQSTSQSIAAMLASLLAGILWATLSSSFVFYFASVWSFLLLLTLIYFDSKTKTIKVDFKGKNV